MMGRHSLSFRVIKTDLWRWCMNRDAYRLLPVVKSFLPPTMNINKTRREKWDAVMTQEDNTVSALWAPHQKTRTIDLWIIHLTSQATEPLPLSSYLINPWHFDWPFKLNNLPYTETYRSNNERTSKSRLTWPWSVQFRWNVSDSHLWSLLCLNDQTASVFSPSILTHSSCSCFFNMHMCG